MTIDPISQPMNSGTELTGHAKERANLKKACQEFESFFINEMLKEMRKTVPKSDLFGDQGSQEEIFRDMSDQALSDTASKRGSFGIANLMYRELSKNIPADPVGTDTSKKA